MAHSLVHLGNTACDCGPVRSSEILLDVRNRTVRTDVRALAAAVAGVLVRIRSARIVLELVLYKQADRLCGRA